MTLTKVNGQMDTFKIFSSACPRAPMTILSYS